MKPRVYLAGPITSLDYEAATMWRTMAQEHLRGVGIAAYSPLRKKEFLTNTEDLTWQDSHCVELMGTRKAILARDYQDCTKADALLVNFLRDGPISIGTVLEMAWAYELRIPVVLMAPEDSVYCRHPMLGEMVAFRVGSLEAGLEAIKHILLPEE